MEKKYLQNRKTVEAVCDSCGALHTKPESEFLRNQTIGRKNYCSRSCAGKKLINNIPLDRRNTYDISQHQNRSDQYTGFRDFIRRARNRTSDVELTLEHLKSIWEAQQGKCIYSGVQLLLPSNRQRNSKVYTASLDRIDSSIGYKDGNVQFVSMAINFMKSDMSHEETLELINIIKNS